MGTVYCVHDERSGQEVALKRMRGSDEDHLVTLFEREYRTLAGIQHPRIIRVFDYGVDAGEPFYTMELVQGRDLYDLAPVPFAQACRYLRDVATCLALLHTRRLLHRDITPRNVRVTPSGDCKLLDFGALTSFGIPERTVGTAPFMPPEAARGAPLDQRADLFSFGALAYWTLTRRHAYPVRSVAELPESWKRRPAPPSRYDPSVPKEADALILSLLNLDPLARPGTMAEVVDRLNALGRLPAEDEATQRALAESYLVQVQFVGRERELSALRDAVTALDRGSGAAMLLRGPRGVGRSRLLAELLLQGQLHGLEGLYADAAMHRQPHGTAIALVHQLLEGSPAVCREAEAHAAILAQLDPSLAARLGAWPRAPEGDISGDWRARIQEVLHDLVATACREGPVLLVVDNADEADEASLALLAGLSRLPAELPLALAISARSDAEQPKSMSWRLLSEKSRAIELAPLSPAETLALARSVFGDAPNLARFAEWLHARGAGRPLHCMELVRKLYADGVVRYLDGLWILPLERPDADVPAGLDDLLATRLSALSPTAYALAEAIAIQRGSLTRERCIALARVERDRPFALLDELLRADVLHDGLHGYRFNHGLVREVLVERMQAERRRVLHLACAQYELARAEASERVGARIEAGWHLLQAGEAGRGADLLADVAYDTVGVRFAFADLQVAAPALEAALEVYTREGRSLHERMPLLTALAQAGYYEDRKWGLRYGDEALDAVCQISGLGIARKLQPWLGNALGLLLGMLLGWLRFAFAPKRGRRYGFRDVIVQLVGVVTTLTGTAASGLDGERAARIAATMRPFMDLPERLTPVGVAQFCHALKEICRENQAEALSTWTMLTSRFQSPRWYISLPAQARPLYVGGLWFARGVFESFRDGRGALEAAEGLECTGLKLYRMIASEIRMLYYANRGELDKARRHRDQVELNAIQIGSLSQVELWEPAALILPYTAMADAIELRRIAERLTVLSESHPSLALYAELARLARDLCRIDQASLQVGGVATSREEHEVYIDNCFAVLERSPPRGFIGWGALSGFFARGLNLLGRHAEARRICERTLSHLGPEDRPFVALFLACEIELAIAEAGTGDADAGLRRLDELLAYHAASDNPLTRGRLHEGHARLSALAEDWASYRHHLEETRSWYRATGTPALIARAEALAALARRNSDAPQSNPAPEYGSSSPVSDELSGMRTGDGRAKPVTDDSTDVATRVLPARASLPANTRELSVNTPPPPVPKK